jgi:hypothetical protein
MTERASLEETLEFCQKVREAGGGAVLDALIPATPQDSNQCLIAKNLNFNCAVACFDQSMRWQMAVDSEELRDKIADSLNLEKGEDVVADENGDSCWLLILPEGIGQVAYDFDRSIEVAHDIQGTLEYLNADGAATVEDVRDFYGEERFDENYKLLQDMWPYIEESVKDTEKFGIFNEKGELIL